MSDVLAACSPGEHRNCRLAGVSESRRAHYEPLPCGNRTVTRGGACEQGGESRSVPDPGPTLELKPGRSERARTVRGHERPSVTSNAPDEPHAHGASLAEVAELLGDTKRVAADHYVYALTDYREVDRTLALARIGAG